MPKIHDLPGMKVFKFLNVKTSELSSFDLFAVNIGPGTSYTAIRASVTFLSVRHALNKPLSGISSEMLEGEP